MNTSTILNIAGRFFAGFSITMLIPLVYSLATGGDCAAAFALSFCLAGGLGLLLMILCKNTRDIRIKDGYILVGLIWLGAGILGGFPFYFQGTAGLIDGIFESVSGFTTTGATIFANIEGLPRALLLWRSLTHWLGGMGIIVLSVAFLPRLGAGAMQMFRAEVPGPSAEKLLPRVRETAKVLWGLYCALTLAQIILLRIAGMGWFDSINHAFATMATGGFSTRNLSIAAYNNVWIEFIVVGFMFAAGVNFAIYYYVWKRRWRLILTDSELKFYAGVLILATLLLTANLIIANSYGSWGEALRHGAFQAVSITTTTGFTTADFNNWPAFSRALLLILKFLGGSAGSTAGAIKQVRLLILLRLVWREIYRLVHPRAISPVRIGTKVVPEELLHNVSAFTLLYLAIFIITGLILAAMNVDIVSSFSASAATLGNIGPGLELVGPINNYGVLPQSAKVILIFNMLLGRLELFTFILFIGYPVIELFRRSQNVLR